MCYLLFVAGEILVWGANNFGQLGLGHVSQIESIPKVVTSLKGVPIAFIACGSNHTFAISKSGAVFGWGKLLFTYLILLG